MPLIQAAAFGVPEHEMKWEGSYRPRISPEQLRSLWRMKRETGKPITELVGEAIEMFLETKGGENKCN